ncbi:hypothetical protein PR048_000268 [Dryococelus australis]|uniref:Uncharacterized protein n=1 Tax=Dryococelus australis TaxID=614101 RepID=A0ABQ9IE67_9NEOP|nr:hypothetical protein PR048_000268 [Dryococelus australis]
MVPKKELLYTRRLAYGTEVLPRRLDKLPVHGRAKSPRRLDKLPAHGRAKLPRRLDKLPSHGRAKLPRRLDKLPAHGRAKLLRRLDKLPVHGRAKLPRRLDKLPAHGRVNLPGTFKHGYCFRKKKKKKKNDTRMRKAITPNEILMATLRYLATGRTFEDLEFSCRKAPLTLGKIIPDTCEAIFKAQRNYCKWRRITWNESFTFTHNHESNDGRCVKYATFAMRNTVGMAQTVKFSGGSLRSSPAESRKYVIAELLDRFPISASNSLRLVEKTRRREPEFAKGGNYRWKNMRYVLVVDDVFPLREYAMKPFIRKVATPAGKIFNYRVFSTIVEKFGIVHKPISLIDLTKVHHIVMACCAIHSSLRSKVPHQYTPLGCLDEEFESGNVTPGPRCNESTSLSKTACHPTDSAKLVRESFVQFFSNEGQVCLAAKVY